jgi:C4-dicarboxylate transporter, DctM subunit
MDALTLSLVSLGGMLVLIALRVPIGIAMGAVAFLGFWYLRNFNVALSALSDTPFVFAASWDLSAIPMFLLMGAIAGNSGIGTTLFRAAHAWFGALPGGLAVATNWACAGFGAASGSSVAAAAVMARLAVPEMLKHKYDKGLATGVCASGGTLDALIPPSITFVIYGVFAEVSVPKLLIAGILPGLLTAAVYMLMIMARCWINPTLAPPVAFADRAALWRERRDSLAGIWPILVLIIGVIGGLYAGVATPTEGGAAGAFLAAVIGLAQRKLTLAGFVDALQDAMATTAQLFFVGIGAILYTKFLALAGTADMFKQVIGDWALDPLLLVVAVSIVYIILGTFMDPLGMILLTIPVFVPMFAALGLDLVWLGVLVVKYIGISLLTPPVGFNIYVVASATDNSIPLQTIYRGCYWFLACEVVIMALLIAFPQISLFLPNLMTAFDPFRAPRRSLRCRSRGRIMGTSVPIPKFALLRQAKTSGSAIADVGFIAGGGNAQARCIRRRIRPGSGRCRRCAATQDRPAACHARRRRALRRRHRRAGIRLVERRWATAPGAAIDRRAAANRRA